jgi:histidyl-tRNA synthetase
MFRRERPQKGRYRQFYQIDAEIFGVQSGLVDVQLIYLLVTLCTRLKLQDVEAHINSLGCPRCRPRFKEALTGFLVTVGDQLCSDCIRRRDRNPLRVLDCKVPSCREALTGAPSLLDYLCEDCRSDFNQVMEALTRLGVSYVIDRQLVRGLDYYTRTAFEIQTTSLGAQSAVAGGGRYDNLVKELGGPDIPATGFAIGLDRLAELAALDAPALVPKPDLFLAALGADSQTQAFEWVCKLGVEGIRVEMDFSDKSLKSQMKRADRLGARYVMILGDNELKEGTAILRNMENKEQISVPLANIVQTIKNMICRRSAVRGSVCLKC